MPSVVFWHIHHCHILKHRTTIGCLFFNFIKKLLIVKKTYMWRLTLIPMINFRYINVGMKRTCWISMERNDRSPLPDNGNSQKASFAAFTHDHLSKCPTLLRSVSIAWFILDWWCHVETKHFPKPSWDMVYCSKTIAMVYLHHSLTKWKGLCWFYFDRPHTHRPFVDGTELCPFYSFPWLHGWFNMLHIYEL